MEKILHIDLSGKDSWIETIEPELLEEWIGGKGLAGYYLMQDIKKNWKDPDMPLIFMTGPLVGTPSPTSGRMCIMSKSPLTGTVGDSSVGGSLGTQIKRAGFDGIIIRGKSENLVGIEIDEDGVDFCGAEKLKGMKVTPLQEEIRGKGAVCMVGPAAENGVLFSGIMVDRGSTAGRGGLGVLMADKKLKYLTVQGKKKVEVEDMDKLLSAREDIFRQVSATPVLMGEYGLSHYGTGAIYDLIHEREMMPTANFRKTKFSSAPKMNAPVFREKYNSGSTGCRGCHIKCKRLSENGVHLPEFETMSHFSALLENEDIEVVKEANRICNEMGMDTISAGSTLACYSEINEKKLKGQKILSLLKDTGMGRGVGRELKRGSYRYAESMGCPEVSMSVKKLELPAYDPRGAYGMALAYVTSTRGGCHLRAYPIIHEILRKPVATNRFSFQGKARIIKIAEDMNSIVDSLTACKFIFFATSLEEYASVYSAATGIETRAQDLYDKGERIYYRERIMNSLNGFNREDDDLPERFFEEEGSMEGKDGIPPIDRGKFKETLEKYYKIRGLNERGRPTGEKADKLGLSRECSSG